MSGKDGMIETDNDSKTHIFRFDSLINKQRHSGNSANPPASLPRKKKFYDFQGWVDNDSHRFEDTLFPNCFDETIRSQTKNV